MTKISIAQDVMILQMTMILCSFMLGLGVGPCVEKLLQRLEAALERMEKKFLTNQKHKNRGKGKP